MGCCLERVPTAVRMYAAEWLDVQMGGYCLLLIYDVTWSFAWVLNTWNTWKTGSGSVALGYEADQTRPGIKILRSCTLYRIEVGVIDTKRSVYCLSYLSDGALIHFSISAEIGKIMVHCLPLRRVDILFDSVLSVESYS